MRCVGHHVVMVKPCLAAYQIKVSSISQRSNIKLKQQSLPLQYTDGQRTGIVPNDNVKRKPLTGGLYTSRR